MSFDANATVNNEEATVEIGGAMVDVRRALRVAIPLNRLFLSARNVRKLRNPESIPSLAATIQAQGLLNSLCVVAEKRKGGKGIKGESFGVVAGGRRLAALQLLVEQGHLAKDAEIECLKFSAEDAAVVSLTENTTQEAMHPADQLEAFKALVDEGKNAGQIAAVFGLSTQTVEKRLKLANLAPMFLQMFREGSIEQAQLMALALTDDQEQQVRVWESLAHWQRSAYMIKEALTEQEVSSKSKVARFVGVDAYREAGGAIREDFFSESGESFLQDSVLLNELAQAKLQTIAAGIEAEGWKWVQTRDSFDYADSARFGRLTAEKRKPTRKEEKQAKELGKALTQVHSRLQELDELESYDEERGEERSLTSEQEAERRQLEDREGELEQEIAAFQATLRMWTDEQKASAGVVLHIKGEGRLEIERGLVAPEDRKAVQAAAREAGSGQYEPPAKERAEFSAAICQNLTAHRTAAVAAALTQSPKVALAALLHTLVMTERASYYSSPIGVRFENNARDVATNAAEFDQSPAAHTLEQADAWQDHVPGDSARLFERLQNMELGELLDLLARFVARSYSVQSPTPKRAEGRGFDPAFGIEQALGMDMADWWTPTAGRYLEQVPKAKMIEAVTEACGAKAAEPIQKMKKADAVATAASLLEGKRWVPSTLRPYVAPLAGEAEDLERDDEASED